MTEMNSIGTVLYATDGSQLSVSNVNVSGNALAAAYARKISSDFTQQTSRNFNVLLATGSSQATGTGFIVTGNSGMDVSRSYATYLFNFGKESCSSKGLNFLRNSVFSVQVAAPQFPLPTQRSTIAMEQV